MATILMVDDEPMLLELYQDMLEPDHQVLLAGSVDEAIQILDVQHVDAVTCDYFLGAGYGTDVVAWIRNHKPGLLSRTVLISGMDRASEVSADILMLYKPVSMETLLEIFAGWFSEGEAHA